MMEFLRDVRLREIVCGIDREASSKRCITLNGARPIEVMPRPTDLATSWRFQSLQGWFFSRQRLGRVGMSRIQQLSPLVVSKIAAGEVIERPASVVKELLENSIDAGARRIDIEVEQGGIELIRIVDDGCGVVPEDLPLVFSSHATSKLRDADDLFRVGTLGFRGEALASIGGVAQVGFQSRPGDRTRGAEISCHGGELSDIRPWNGSPGTRIEVRHLFYNTPVRRKFLRTTATEMGQVSEAVTRVALSRAHPKVGAGGLHLALRHNNKNVVEIPATATLLDRVGRFFGPDVSNQLYSVETKQGPASLCGYIADPACERGTARMQYLFLNGRWIRDRSLGHAVQEAYRGLLMTGRYAVVFLFIDLPPDLVDVNVHPTKAEVRFRDSQALHHLVFSTLRDRLRRENLTARLQVPSTLQAAPERPPAPAFAPPAYTAPPPSAMPPREVPPPLPTRVEAPARSFAPPSPASPDLPFAAASAPSPVARSMPQPPPMPTNPPTPGPAKVIQLYDSYLVVETDAGMLVIDQHALHERILFEQIKARYSEGRLEVQPLLIPEPMEFTPDQAARTLEARDELRELGLGVDDFGGGTLLLTSYPALLGRRDPQVVLRAVVDHLMTNDRLPARAVLFNGLFSLLACHAAVRAGDRLTPEEMDALVAQRALADDTHHCPHGRPTALLFSKLDLERQFRRV
jgi:DNA mismatch repair protein MutL